MGAAGSAEGVRHSAVTGCQTPQGQYLQPQLLGLVLGPIVGLVIWWWPLGLALAAYRSLVVAAFMLLYWVSKPIDYGITALLGCFLFWARRLA